MDVLAIDAIPGWPSPAAGARECLDQALLDAGVAQSVTSPDGLRVGDGALALSFLSSYVGSAAELEWNKDRALDALMEIYGGKFAAGFNYVGSDSVRRTFQIDATSQFNIDVQANASLGAILGGEAWNADSYFIAGDNSHMPTPTAQDMRNFALAVRAYVSGLILVNRAIKDAIAAAADMTALAAIDVSAGWPDNS